MPSNHPTIRDVARLAGVSHQTVSRVINGLEVVSPETREKVESAIVELDYRPSAIARSMARGTTHTVACIAPNLTDYTFASIIEGAEREARNRGYFLLSSSAENAETFQELVEELVGHRHVDGLIVINPYADERDRHVPSSFPVVFVGASTNLKDLIHTVRLDDEAAGYEATRHLAGLGHRRIAMVTGPLSEDCSRDRRTGFLRAMTDSGLEVETRLVLEGDWSASTGYTAMLSFAKSGSLPDAVFAQNDRMAMGVMRAARDLGLSIPDQLAVIGVDDMPLASYFDPPLTTMNQDMPRIGHEAVRVLLDEIENPGRECQQVKLSAQLIVRQSTHKGGG